MPCPSSAEEGVPLVDGAELAVVDPAAPGPPTVTERVPGLQAGRQPVPEQAPEPQQTEPEPEPATGFGVEEELVPAAAPPLTRAHAAAGRTVSLGFLAAFVREHRGMVQSWSVAREFLAPEDGGGGGLEVVVTRETLQQHRARKRRAELARTGRPAAARYVDIPFSLLYTTDVVESIVRPVARSKHRSFAEAVEWIPPLPRMGLRDRCLTLLGADDLYAKAPDVRVGVVGGRLAGGCVSSTSSHKRSREATAALIPESVIARFMGQCQGGKQLSALVCTSRANVYNVCNRFDSHQCCATLRRAEPPSRCRASKPLPAHPF
jgi:hypothetical protein